MEMGIEREAFTEFGYSLTASSSQGFITGIKENIGDNVANLDKFRFS